MDGTTRRRSLCRRARSASAASSQNVRFAMSKSRGSEGKITMRLPARGTSRSACAREPAAAEASRLRPSKVLVHIVLHAQPANQSSRDATAVIIYSRSNSSLSSRSSKSRISGPVERIRFVKTRTRREKGSLLRRAVDHFAFHLFFRAAFLRVATPLA